SAMKLDSMLEISIEISEYTPIGGGHHIPLPETMPKRNNGVINIQNNDDWCFGWSVLGSLHPVQKNPQRISKYQQYVNEINMEDIPIPVPISTPVYKKFEENNPEISLCVYQWNNDNKYLEYQYLSERIYGNYKEVNLLVITDPEIEYAHYCIIKDLHKLVYNHSNENIYAVSVYMYIRVNRD